MSPLMALLVELEQDVQRTRDAKECVRWLLSPRSGVELTAAERLYLEGRDTALTLAQLELVLERERLEQALCGGQGSQAVA